MIWIEHLISLSSSLQKYTVVYSARFIQSGPYQRSVHFTTANEQIELNKQGSLSLMHKTQEFLSL